MAPTWQSLSDGDFWEAIDRTLATIPNARNRERVKEYIQERHISNIGSKATLGTDANILRTFFETAKDKQWDKMTKADVMACLLNPTRKRIWRNRKADGSYTETMKQTKPLSDTTRAQHRIRVRHFFKWALDHAEGYPAIVATIKAGRRHDKDDFDTKQTISEADLKAILREAKDARTKAVVAVLYDSGCRAQEFCNLRVRDFHPDEYGGYLMLPPKARGNKTGARQIRLGHSIPHLAAWLNIHPFRKKPDAALFLSDSRRKPNAPMTPHALYQMVATYGERAGIDYQVHPQLFRHSAATEKAKLGLNEDALRKHFGWSRTSDMPSHYVHLKTEDYHAQILAAQGIKVETVPLEPALRIVKCPNPTCNTMNVPEADYCERCACPLTPDAQVLHAEQRQESLRRELAILIAREGHDTEFKSEQDRKKKESKVKKR